MTRVDRKPKVLNDHQVSLKRDITDNYNPLEKLIGTLMRGMSFGESILLGNKPDDFRDLPYQAIALSDVICLQMEYREFQYMLDVNKRRIAKDKIDFLAHIPELRPFAIGKGFHKQS